MQNTAGKKISHGVILKVVAINICGSADFNLIKFPDKAQAMSKIRDLTMLSDILPTGFHGAVTPT
jgi:hypothetical protein